MILKCYNKEVFKIILKLKNIKRTSNILRKYIMKTKTTYDKINYIIITGINGI